MAPKNVDEMMFGDRYTPEPQLFSKDRLLDHVAVKPRAAVSWIWAGSWKEND
jgi:hypothetical protein